MHTAGFSTVFPATTTVIPPRCGKRAWRQAGFQVERWWHYFSERALRTLEWGHYWGLPSWISKVLTGRFILSPTSWNLALTRRRVQPYYDEAPQQGAVLILFTSPVGNNGPSGCMALPGNNLEGVVGSGVGGAQQNMWLMPEGAAAGAIGLRDAAESIGAQAGCASLAETFMRGTIGSHL